MKNNKLSTLDKMNASIIRYELNLLRIKHKKEKKKKKINAIENVLTGRRQAVNLPIAI